MDMQTTGLLAGDSTQVRVLGGDGHVRPWQEIREEILEKAIAASNLNLTKACTRLGVPRSTVYRRLSRSGS